MTKCARTGGWVSPVEEVRNPPTTDIARAVEERAQREEFGLNSDDPLGALETVVDEVRVSDAVQPAGLAHDGHPERADRMALNEPSWRPPRSWTIRGSLRDTYKGWNHDSQELPDLHIRQLYVRELTHTFRDLTHALLQY